MSKDDESDLEEIMLWRLTKRKQYLTVNPVLRCLIDGVSDELCVLSKLNGSLHILLYIWTIVKEYWEYLGNCIVKGKVDPEDILHGERKRVCGLDQFHYLNICVEVIFPPQREICINMMPFVMAETFEACKLPTYLKAYWDQIIKVILSTYCLEEMGKVGYLTIQESYVEKEKSQRRGGVHIESPGSISVQNDTDGKILYLGREKDSVFVSEEKRNIQSIKNGCCHIFQVGWGGGNHMYSDPEFSGGIYMVSNVDNSCEIWNCGVLPDKQGREVIGDLGDVEHLRNFLGPSHQMWANEVYWLTDRTPHESLPAFKGRDV